MKKNIVLYALSTAINKGSVLVFFPLLTQILSLENFGLWSLIIVVSNLILPILSLNGSASILREGSARLEDGYMLMKGFAGLTVLASVLAYCILWILKVDDWILYSVLIAAGEAVLFLALTYLRAKEKAFIYFIINLLKVLCLLLMLLVARAELWGLHEILKWHVGIVLSFAGLVLIFELFQGRSFKASAELNWKWSLFFCVTLIPHSLFQWMMSSSDRLIIKYQLGDASLGAYSLAYNIALILMLVNSGIALALPTYMIRNYTEWKERNYDNVFIRIYSFISVALFVLVLCGYYLDSKYFFILGYYGVDVVVMTTLIYAGLYILGLYYFYSNHLFYHNKSVIISVITFKVALFSVVLAFALVYALGVMGAAIATLMSYALYLYLVRAESIKVDQTINIRLVKPVSYSLLSFCLISTFIGYLSAV